MTGMAMLGAGAGGLYLLDKIVKPATEYAHQLQLMNVSGMKHLEIVKATQAAWDAMKVTPTTTAAENLAAIRELRMVFGDTGHAIKYMPLVQQMQGVLSNLLGGNAGDQAYTVAKALEMKGAVRTPGEFKTQADLMVKAMVASGGKVGATDFLQAFKYGRAATTGWSDAFTYSILPTLIQEMKGGGSGGRGGPGQALMSMYSAVVGGTIPQKSLKVWEKLGLLDPHKIVWTKTHSAKGIEPGGIMGSNLFQSNPFEWTQKVLLPALNKAGYRSPEQQKEALQYLFPNRTAGFIATQMVQQGWKFTRDQRLIGQASGIGAYNQLLKNDPEMAALALHQQWTNLMAQLGFTVMPALIKGMQWLIPHVEQLTAWTQKHGTMVKGILEGFAALSAVLMVGGALNLTIAGLRGIGLALKFAAIGGPAGIIRIAGAIRVWGGAIAMSNVGGAAGIAGIGKSLTSMAGALGLITQAVAVFMAAYAGWKAGGWLNRNVINPLAGRATGVKGETFGTLLYGYLNPVDANGNNSSSFWRKTLFNAGPMGTAFSLANMFASDDPDGLKAYRANRAGAKTVQVHTTINMDGKKVATAVSKHQASAMTAPQTGVTGTDLSSAPPPVGLNLSPVH